MYAKLKCNKKFIKADSPNLQFISMLSVSLCYLLSVNFCPEMFFFFFWKNGIPACTFSQYIATKFMMPNTSFLATTVTLSSTGVAILARLTIADHSCSNKCSMERVGKVKNTDKAKKCNTCDLIPLSEINTKHHKRTHNSLTCRLLFLDQFIT